jgi:hypothetical protein
VGRDIPIDPDEICDRYDTPVNRIQEGGCHYKRLAIQPWDYVASNDLDYFQGSIIKYITRWKDKGGIEDLQKAKHFLDKYIEVNI